MPIRVRYRITTEMIEAGANAMEQCRQLGGHTPRTAAQAVFTAMLEAADVNPGTVLRKAFMLSPHDTPPRPKRLTRDDFDVDGIRRTTRPDGSERIELLRNFHYLRGK